MDEKQTPLYQRIYRVVEQIPPGKVATYGQIAGIVGGCSAQMVGFALSALRPGSDVPWQRVINARGRISPRGGGPGALIQRELLEAEGVEFDPEHAISFEKYGWI